MRVHFSLLKTLLGRENLPQRRLAKGRSVLVQTPGEKACVMTGFSLGLSELNWAKEHLLMERKQLQRRGSKFQFSRSDTRYSSTLKMTHTVFPGRPVVKNHFAMERTLVQSLVQEDPTCLRATKPRRGNYWVCAPDPRSCNCWSPCTLQSVLSNKRRQYHEKPVYYN